MMDIRHGLGSVDESRKGDWQQVYGMRKFWPLDPRPAEVHHEVVAHALALQCRFGGHVNAFYSVAEHSVRVSLACDPKDALWGLLHDASEAFLCDLVRPVKVQPEYEPYRRHEAAIMKAVCIRYALVFARPESVSRADEVLLATEARDLISPECLTAWRFTVPPLPERIDPWTWQEAETRFLARFAQLTGGRY